MNMKIVTNFYENIIDFNLCPELNPKLRELIITGNKTSVFQMQLAKTELPGSAQLTPKVHCLPLS
jgi:hypothetical protein